MNEQDKELIQAGVDDELDARGRERLNALLARSEAARALHEDLLRLNAFIDRVPPQPVPDGLHRRIVSGVELPQPGGPGRWLTFSALPGFLRYGLAGAAAVVLTVAVYRGGEGLSPGAEVDLVGAIASRGDMAGAREVDRLRFDAPGASGQVSLVARDDAHALAFELDLDQPARVRVVLPESGYRFEAVAQQDDALSAMSWSGNRIEAVADGQRRFVLRVRRGADLAAGDQRIGVDLTRGDELLFSGTLALQSGP